jgi:hypothetical protein
MGLDIRAFERLIPVADHLMACRNGLPEEWCENEDHLVAYAYPEFPLSFGSVLETGRCYTAEGGTMGFHAGSYGGYNRWRDGLARFALGVPAVAVFGHPERYAEAPFVLLINFADNEGMIGPDASKLLAADFAEHRDRYAEHVTSQCPPSEGQDQREHSLQRYADWEQAFELASHGGAVVFR